jgi:glycine cleavage system H protein
MNRKNFIFRIFSLLLSIFISFKKIFSKVKNYDIIIPDDLFYTCDHEWLRIEEDIGTVGITDYCQMELGEIIYVDLPIEINTDVRQHDSLGSIEAIKTVSEVFCPVSGKIVELNFNINDNAGIINSDPYGKGWLLKLKLSDKSELKGLLDAEEYRKLVNG